MVNKDYYNTDYILNRVFDEDNNRLRTGVGGLSDSIYHIPKFMGDIWYVDAGMTASGDGTTIHGAFKTITEAFAAWSAGDRTVVKAGFYNENGLEIALDGCELWFEIGAAIINTTPGTCIKVTGDYCLLSGIVTIQAGQIGFDIDGTGVMLMDCISATNSVAFDIDGPRCTLTRCRDQDATVTGYDIASAGNTLFMCNSIADHAGSRGFYLSHDDAHLNMIYQCLSNGNTVASFETVAGADKNAFAWCSADSCCPPIDAGDENIFDIKIGDPIDEHETTYPNPNGEGRAGDAVRVQSEINDETGADTTMNYYGDSAVLMPVGVLTNMWHFRGVNLFAQTAADEQRFHCYRMVAKYSGTRNGGNAWDEGATILTLQDAAEAAQFKVDDKVIVISPNYQPNGEIVKVTAVLGATITIARSVENSGRTGLHWNHTANDAGNEVLYLCERDSELQYSETKFDHSATGARAFMTQRWQNPRRMLANDGVALRMINGTDGANSLCDVTIIWGH